MESKLADDTEQYTKHMRRRGRILTGAAIGTVGLAGAGIALEVKKGRKSDRKENTPPTQLHDGMKNETKVDIALSAAGLAGVLGVEAVVGRYAYTRLKPTLNAARGVYAGMPASAKRMFIIGTALTAVGGAVDMVRSQHESGVNKGIKQALKGQDAPKLVRNMNTSEKLGLATENALNVVHSAKRLGMIKGHQMFEDSDRVRKSWGTRKRKYGKKGSR
jgi:hypothetical protein